MIVETKECLNCHKQMEKKPSFSASYWGERKLCGRECQSQWMKGMHNSLNTEFKPSSIQIKLNCSECGTPFSAYAPNAKYCSDLCLRLSKQRAVKLHPDYALRARRSSLKRKFGISLEDYDNMLETQGFRCAICRVHHTEISRNLAVDHDHVTGHVRGLLCVECNRGLGAFKDSETFMFKAINYLRKGGKL